MMPEAQSDPKASAGKVKAASTEQVAALFDKARRVVIVPGYGMALSHAQHAVRELTHLLESRGIEVEFAVHPVAGRMPGHMNVILAGADISYEKVKGMEEINPSFARTDVAIVIGASDVVNPLARHDPQTPLAGMEILDVDKAKTVVVVKRSLEPGYSGIQNPLFGADNALMLFGDGEKAVLDVIVALKNRPRGALAAQRRIGSVSSWQLLSPSLALFRLQPHAGTRFPDYKPGQYIALRRDDCRLTRRVVDTEDGRRHYIPDLDDNGVQRRGPVTHSYSISSPPFETLRDGHLEFYVVLEEQEWGFQGRLTESMFRVEPGRDDGMGYVDRIVGDFTLDKRAKGFRNVVMVGTGTGLAPFASMLRQIDHEVAAGKADPVCYTLFHANRTREELAYHAELLAVEAAARFDFVYVASTSRPKAGEPEAARLGTGRANNLMRHVFGMPLREEEDLAAVKASGADDAAARAQLDKVVRPRLPSCVDLGQLRERMTKGETVVLSCGNPAAMEDVRRVAEQNGLGFEKEDWKHVPSHS
jgi:ferredoxin-NADP reductase